MSKAAVNLQVKDALVAPVAQVLIARVWHQIHTAKIDALVEEENTLAHEIYADMNNQKDMLGQFERDGFNSCTISNKLPILLHEKPMLLRLRQQLPMPSDFAHFTLRDDSELCFQLKDLLSRYRMAINERPSDVSAIRKIEELTKSYSTIPAFLSACSRINETVKKEVDRVLSIEEMLREQIRNKELIL